MSDNLPAITSIMNTYYMFAPGRAQVGAGGKTEIKKFLSHVPLSLKRELHNAIMKNDSDRAVGLACRYVVTFFSYIPIEQCKYHGTFVYALLKQTIDNSVKLN